MQNMTPLPPLRWIAALLLLLVSGCRVERPVPPISEAARPAAISTDSFLAAAARGDTARVLALADDPSILRSVGTIARDYPKVLAAAARSKRLYLLEVRGDTVWAGYVANQGFSSGHIQLIGLRRGGVWRVSYIAVLGLE